MEQTVSNGIVSGIRADNQERERNIDLRLILSSRSPETIAPSNVVCCATSNPLSSAILKHATGQGRRIPCTYDFTHALLSSPFAYQSYSPPRLGPRRLHTSPTSSQATTALSDPKTRWWSRGRLTKLYP